MSEPMGQDAGGETARADWTAELGDHAALVASKGWKSPADVVKSYAHLERLVGADRIAVPKAGDDEGFRAAMRKLGAPEEAKGYQLALPKGIPDGWYRQDAAESFRALAHKAALTPAQARVLHDGWVGTLMDAEQRQAVATHQAQARLEQDLRAQWSGAYDQKLELARRAARHFGDATELDALEGAIGSPALLRLFARIGEHFGEDTLVGQGGGRFAVSAGEAREEIATLKHDPDFMAALANDGHLGHADAKAKWRRLHETAYPGVVGA